MAKNTDKSQHPKAVMARLSKMSQGFKTVFQPTDAIDVEGTSTPAGQAATELDADLARYASTDAAHEAYESVKQDRDTNQPVVLARLEAFEIGLRAKLGTTSTKLVSFGLKPKAQAKRTAANKAKAAAKAKATRQQHDGKSAPPATPQP
ncbi:MAG TPA: hypothetical protein VFF73_00555 [Planctomycetota bacterium]|nr:hypothetical protein [Planctomycetota bacterium]